MARSPDREGYERYLLAGERVVVALHRHWAMVAKPVASVVAGLVLAIWVDIVAPPGAQPVSTGVWWLWFGVVAWMLWELVQWRSEWFLATDKRLILTQGIIAKNVAMMPLTKVTDLSYVRTLPGRVIGYGQFVLESAGQDQALREVLWIPHPDATYRAICAEIFGSPDDDARPEAHHHEPDEHDARDEDDERDEDGAWAPAWLSEPPEHEVVRRSSRPQSAVVERPGFSQAMPVTPPPPAEPDARPEWLDSYDASHELYEPWDQRDPTGPPDEGESLYVSDDIARRQRADDTGPIPRYDD